MTYLDRKNTTAKLLLSLLLLFVLSGCNPFKRYVYVHDRYPVYDVPPKAEIAKVSAEDFANLDDKTQDKIVRTINNLKLEASELRSIINSYNEYAKKKNLEYSLYESSPK